MTRSTVFGSITRRGALAGAVAAPFVLASGARAQSDWPNKPVKFIVPFPPGGSVDPLARMVGAKMNASLGQQFIVDNRPGASGSVGAGIAAKSPPDGYTFLFVFDTHGVNPSLIPQMPFDTMKDLEPLMLVGTSPMLIAAHPDRSYKTFTDVVNAAKAKPGSPTIGSIGNGSLGHLTMTLLQQAGKFEVTHVPYKGGGPLMQDLLAGHVDLGIGTTALMASNVRAGKIRPLAVTGDKRSALMPDVPSLADQGFAGFSALAWWGVLAPTGVPAPILEKFHAELVKALNAPDSKKLLTETLGMDLMLTTPGVFKNFLAREVDRWGKVVRENNIKAD